jgi:tRNA G18 (ribose-2'-O)-methylase SpoU
MNIIPIEDPADPRMDPYRNLRHEDVTKRGDRFIAEGRLVVRRLITSRYCVNSVLAEPNRLRDLEDVVDPFTPVYLVQPSVIREVAGFNFHRGLLACGDRIDNSPMEALDDICIDHAIVLAALTINDAENLGSLLRSAAALGVFHVVINRQTADPFCRRVLRVSMGAVLKMHFYDLEDELSWFTSNKQQSRWATIATTLADDSVSLEQVDCGAMPKMIVMGNEAEGLPISIQQACLIRANIPMTPGIDSLNVAVAGAIALYELTRKARSQTQ